VSVRGSAFDTGCLAAQGGAPFDIDFDNRDEGIAHNVSIYANGSSVFTGKIVTGPVAITYRVGALSPGTYVFQCDVHPSQMVGQFVVG